MAGRMGNKKVTKQNLKIISIDESNNLLIIKGQFLEKKFNYFLLKRFCKKIVMKKKVLNLKISQ